MFAHPPFDPPQELYQQYLDSEIPEPVIGEWADIEDDNSGYMPVTRKGKVPENRLRRARAAYYALIAHLDFEIGKFINIMQEFGVLNNTIILFTSDHGEMLGDHHRFAKSLPYEGSSAVPFIIHDSGNHLKLKRGSRVEQTVELRDIMPTLLDAAGVESPDTVDGKSVLPLAQGKKTEWREYIHGEHSYGAISNHYVTNGKEKYIWFSQTGEEQYFDLENDPHELTDRSKDEGYEERVSALRLRLIHELKGREEGYSDGQCLVVGKKTKSLSEPYFINEEGANECLYWQCGETNYF